MWWLWLESGGCKHYESGMCKQHESGAYKQPCSFWCSAYAIQSLDKKSKTSYNAVKGFCRATSLVLGSDR